MKEIFVSIATYSDRFEVIIPTLNSLKWQSVKKFNVEIHVGKDDFNKNNIKAEKLIKFVSEDPRFKIVKWDKDLGPYKKWLSCKLHKDAYILTGSDRVIYDRDFVKYHSSKLELGKRLVYNGDCYPYYVNEDLVGVRMKSFDKTVPGYYDIGFGSTFDSSILKDCWFDLEFAYDTGVMNDDKFFHFILASHGIQNVKIATHRKSHNNSIPRLGKKPNAYNWLPLFEKLKSEKPDLFRRYVTNIKTYLMEF